MNDIRDKRSIIIGDEISNIVMKKIEGLIMSKEIAYIAIKIPEKNKDKTSITKP